MNSYYCARCNLLHARSLNPNAMIFTSGFHWKEAIIYQVGVCSKYFIVPIVNTAISNSFLVTPE
jgi:hypothetical protein